MTPLRWGALTVLAVAGVVGLTRAIGPGVDEASVALASEDTSARRTPAGAGTDSLHAAPTRVPAPAPSALARALSARVDALIDAALAELARATGLGRSDVQVSVHVVDGASGAELAARAPDVALRPASNMKLLTTAAALVHLGPDGAFETRFELLGSQRGATFDGDLVVRAGGDPLYAHADPAFAEARLDAVARALRERGITSIRGQLWLDEGSFEAPGPGPEWPPKNQFWQESCALAGGFSANGGILVARVTPGAVGERARIEVHPTPPGLREKYKVTTVSKRVNDVRVGANAAGVTVGGKLGRSVGPVEAGFAHPDPVDLFASVLLDRLRRGGVDLAGGVRRERAAPPGHPLCVLATPMESVLGPINTHSVNSVADQLFLATALAVSGTATRAAGEAATRRALAHLGVSAEGLRQVDGSGLSRANRVTARQLTSLLRAVGSMPTAEAYRASLAVAGRTGTLDDRMTDGPAAGRVWAKTGWIRGTSALSGFALAQDGSERIVSILVSYPKERSGLNTRHFKPLQDALLEAIVEAVP